MKSRNLNKPAIATTAAWWFSNVVVAAKAFRYGYAADRDERKGFPYTAAMEWRKAAELFSPIPQVSDRCWQKWERIMDLPRHVANPIAESAENVAVLKYSPVRYTHTTPKAVVTEAFIASVA